MTSMVEQIMVHPQLYDPSNVFQDDNSPRGMTGPTNIKLAVSFYNSRHNGAESHKCNADGHARDKRFDRNAGAVQLYNKDSISIYNIPGHEDKEYHFISYGNKDFKSYTKQAEKAKKSSYGHSERILMRDILDDLIFADKPDNHDILRPSDDLNVKSASHEGRIYEVLKKLTDEPRQYKEYLESKNIIVKMWSERPACTRAPDDGVGGACTEFIKNIFPKGSQFGFIVEGYQQSVDNQGGAPKAFEEFKKAYLLRQ